MKQILLTFLCFFYCATGFAQQQELLAFDNKQPIDITADALTVDDMKLQGDFTGTVNVIQGKTHLRCDKLTIFYQKNATNKQADSSAQGEGLSNSQIKTLIATGNVFLVSEGNNAKADKMNYQLNQKKITMTGNVLVNKDKNIIKGDVVDIYTETKQIYVHSNGSRRIHTIIQLDKKS